METATLTASPAAPEIPATLTLAQAAELLQMNADYFRTKLPKLEQEGFPRRLPGVARWSRRAVVEWIERDRSEEQ